MASTQPMPSKCAAGATRARRLLLPHTAPFVPIFAAGPPGQGKKSCAREPCAFAGGGFARGKMAQPPRAEGVPQPVHIAFSALPLRTSVMPTIVRPRARGGEPDRLSLCLCACMVP